MVFLLSFDTLWVFHFPSVLGMLYSIIISLRCVTGLEDPSFWGSFLMEQKNPRITASAHPGVFLFYQLY